MDWWKKKKKMMKVFSYAGEDVEKSRKECLSNFENTTGSCILVAMSGVCEAGLNLQSANRVLVAMLPTELITFLQAPSRVVRVNQTKEVSLIFLLIDSSVESHWFSRFILPRIRLHQQLMNGRTSVGLHLEESIKAVNESDSIVQQQLVEDPFLRKILAKSCVSSITGSCCSIKQEFFEN